MKRFLRWMACAPLALSLALFAACGPSGAEDASGPVADGTQQETQHETQQETQPEASGGGSERPSVSPLAVLEEVDIPAAFGDDGTEEWSFALGAEGGFDAAYEFCFTSGITGREKFYTRLGAALSWDDALGLRADPQSELGFSVFGGGSVGVNGTFVAPASDSEERSLDYRAGFVHDGLSAQLVGSGGEQDDFLLSELGKFLSERGVLRTFRSVAEEVPEGLREGELRLAVEKLVSLGFRAEVSTESGVFVRLTADHAFYTDLLNDFLEEFLPEDWLPYIPRADVRYESTDFCITLAFGEDGTFEQYSVESDLSFAVSLEVRGLFVCESTLSYGGTYCLRSV